MISSAGSPSSAPVAPSLGDLKRVDTSKLGKSEYELYKAYKDDLELAQWVREEYGKMRTERAQTVFQWNINLAFYGGRQYVQLINSNIGKLFTPQVPKHRVRLTINRIRPIIRTEIAKLTAQKPSASVIPASADDQDLAAANAAEQVWESIANQKKLRQKYNEAIFWMCITGTGFLKVWWDPSIKDPSHDPVTPSVAGDGTPTPPGDVNFGCVTPYHLFVPDLRTKDIQEQPYVLNVYTRTIEQLKLQYGDRITGMKLSPDTVSTNEILSNTTLGLPGASRTPDSVLVYEMWCKPGAHKLLPKGGMVQVAADQIIYSTREGLPYSHGEFPFIKFEHIPNGKFYADSVIVDVIGLQKEYNRTRSQVTEAKNRMSKPQLMAPKGSVIASKITTEPGLLIEYTPGLAPPQPLPLQPLPSYVLQEQDRIIADMEDLSGQHQVSRGETPSGVTAATAISYLQEKDDSILSHTFQSVESGWEDLAKQCLGLIVQYWDTKRFVRVSGGAEYFDILQLQGSDIKNSTDVRMEGGSSLPTSKAARQAFILDLMKMNFITPEDGLSMLDVGGTQRIFDTIKKDRSQATRENIKLKQLDPSVAEQQQQQYQQLVQQHVQQQQMQPPPQMLAGPDGQPMMDPAGIPTPMSPPRSVVSVNEWDNHAVHIQVHNDFRKSQEFELLDPAIQAEFAIHVNAHVQAENVAMQQVQAATGGMPQPGASGAGAPPMQNSQAGSPDMGGAN